MDKAKKIIFGAVLLVLLASCSQVFEAGISGKVVTPRGTSTAAVADVNVFAYTDKGRRDSDFAKFQSGTITRPTEGAGYVATTSTNANGQFTVNKVVWETHKSEFGKTADVNKLYLIFYHKDYKPAKEDATVISGSTNAENVYVELEGNKSYTTINVRINDVATKNQLATQCTLEYEVEGAGSSDRVAVANGSASVQISFPKDTTPDVTFILTSPGTNWKMAKEDGTVTEQAEEYDVEEGTLDVTLYMKRYEFVLPSFDGYVLFGGNAAVSSEPANGNDGLQVWLEYRPAAGGDYVPIAESVNANHLTSSVQTIAGNTISYRHGRFAGVGGNGYSVSFLQGGDYGDAVDWASYAGEKTATLKLRLVFSDGTTQKYYPFDFNSSSVSTTFNNIVLP